MFTTKLFSILKERERESEGQRERKMCDIDRQTDRQIDR